MKKQISVLACFIFCISLFSFPACSDKTVAGIPKNADVLADIEKAYVFGFPAVLMYINERVMTNPVKGSDNMPLNRFKHTSPYDSKSMSRVFADADFLHSTAWIELSREPLIFEIPDMKERYAFFPVIDAWTNITASPGKRTTGTALQRYLITPPGWNGKIPDGMTQIKSSSNMALIRGRIQVNSREDSAKNAASLQQKLKLVPLSKYEEKNYKPADQAVDAATDMQSPVEQIFKMDIVTYFNLLNALIADNPPYAADELFLESISYLKIAPGAEFDLSLFDEEKQQAIRLIPSIVKKRFEDSYAKKELVNGWEFMPFASEASKSADYEERALKAFGKLQNDLPDDAVSIRCSADADGMELDGKNKYILRFESDSLPPVSAFWSLTLYNGKGMFYANSLNRYSVSDRKTLKKNNDGSIEIYIRSDSPGKAKESNWLPAPKEPFFLVFNAYNPKEELRKKQWNIPAVTKIKSNR